MQLVAASDVPDGAALVVLYELPETAEALRAIQAHTPQRLVALLQPRQIGALRAFTGDAVAAYTFGDARRDAAAREDALRDEIRAELSGGAPTRELLALEPLLAEHDGVEIAAALLHLLSDARRHGGARGAAVLEDEAPAAPWTRVYVNVGTKDGVGAGDVLGALAGEGNIGREKIGRIELRDTHTLVDVSTDVVEQVVESATGASLRGRRVTARVDKDRASTPRAGSAPAGDRPPRGDRPDRGDRAPRVIVPRHAATGPSAVRASSGVIVATVARAVSVHRAAIVRRPVATDSTAVSARRGAAIAATGSNAASVVRVPTVGIAPIVDRGPTAVASAEIAARDRRERAVTAVVPSGRQARSGRRSYGRTLKDEQAEWASRADRLKNARRPRNDE